MRYWFGLALACLAPVVALATPWATRDAPPGTGAPTPTAVNTNQAGDQLALGQDAQGGAYLEFTAAAGFSALSASSCPTFQVDQRTPIHHFAVGQACAIERQSAHIDLGHISDYALVSIVVDQLMNGNKVTFRYLTADGAYHQADFALTRSAGAIRRALGRSVRVRAR